MTPRCVLVCVALLILLVAGHVAAQEAITFDFENPDSPLNEEWASSPLDGASQSVRITDEMARSGSRSLKVYGKLPEGFGVMYEPWRDWTGYTKLSFDLYVPEAARRCGKEFDCWAYIKDSSYYWFQTSIYKDVRTLKPLRKVQYEKWVRFELDISPDSTMWQPGGHERAWGAEALYKPREFGLRFFGEKPFSGAVHIDNLTLSGYEAPLGKRPREPLPRWDDLPPLHMTANAWSVPAYEKFELTFELDGQYENPFDPEVVDVRGVFTAPSGETLSVPGFYYQAYDRSLSDEGFERLTPVGWPVWKVRFAPKEVGEYTFHISVDEARDPREYPPAKFTATDPIHPEGYLRVSEKDPLYFEFENGDWFYPIGINMRDGGDDASDQKGTYEFDHYFKRFREEGVNFVRTWMCAWWGGIEWSDEYHSRFHDVGRYNMYNAWRLDHCVDLAAENDIYLEMTLNSHGQVRRDKFDEEWSYSPWNTRNGGHVASPAMFFSSERVKKEFRNRYRYIVARWGYSRNIAAWDLWNEVDLVEGYDTTLVPAWHKEMAQYLKSIDPWKHMIVTHICLFWSFGNEMWQLPEIECVQSDAYWDQSGKKQDKRMDMGMYASYAGKTDSRNAYEPRFKKPFLFIEYGPLYASVAAGKVSPDDWRRRFRIGQWTSAVIPNAAPAVFWYHKEWDEFGLHRYQEALRKLFGDYDRRGKDFRLRVSGPPRPTIFLRKGGNIKAIGMVNDDEGFFYIHDHKKMGPEDRSAIERTEGAIIKLYKMAVGRYDIEFIDTMTADVIGTAEATLEDARRTLEIPLPPIADDLLMRVSRREG